MRFTSLLAATGLLASGLAVGTPAHAVSTGTQALPECRPLVPARLVIRARITTYKIGLSATCPATLYNADWLGIQPGDPEKTKLEFLNGARTAKLDLYSNVSPIGAVTWTPTAAGGTDRNGDEVATLKPVASTTRYASSATISGKRVGGTTTLVATVGYYNPKTNAFVRWPGKLVTLQYKAPGTSTWKYLTRVTTNRVGQGAFTWTPRATKHYRAYVPANRTIWDFTTAAISK